MKLKLKMYKAKGTGWKLAVIFLVVFALLVYLYYEMFGFGETKLFDILGICLALLYWTGFTFLLLMMNTVALLNEEGVTLKERGKVVGEFKWSEVINVRVEEIIETTNNGDNQQISYRIMIDTNEPGYNIYKRKSPYMFLCTKENQEGLNLFLKKYCPQIDSAVLECEYKTGTIKPGDPRYK